MARESVQAAARDVFPPYFTPVRLRERQDAFAEACREAAEMGAGTIFHVGRFDLIEFAVVLEPEEPLATARRAFFAGMNAVADALAAICPPEKPISFLYPGAIRFDGGLVGGGRLAWPEAAAEDVAPDWLVFSCVLRAGGFQELGFVLDPHSTTLEEEGFKDLDAESFAASFCRHLMVILDEWQERGFKPVGQNYLARMERAAGDGQCGVDVNGDLLVHPKSGGGAARRSLTEALLAPDWYDHTTGGLRA